MDEFGSIFDILFVAYGVDFLYLALSSKIKKEPFPASSLMPQGCTIEKCKDPEAFTAFMFPRVLLFGTLMILFGVTAFFGLLGSFLLIACVVFFALLIVFFFVVLKRAAKLFW